MYIQPTPEGRPFRNMHEAHQLLVRHGEAVALVRLWKTRRGDDAITKSSANAMAATFGKMARLYWRHWLMLSGQTS